MVQITEPEGSRADYKNPLYIMQDNAAASAAVAYNICSAGADPDCVEHMTTYRHE